MRIVVAEIQGEQQLSAREFKQTTIKIGRDQVRCDLSFAQSAWPMVSRLHAELRLEGNTCILTDLNSRQGTFLNGKKIAAPIEVAVGARIQFGNRGPIISVESIEPGNQSPQPVASAGTLVDIPVSQKPHLPSAGVSEQTYQAAVQQLPLLTVESGATTQPGQQFRVKPGITLLGRDATADVSVNAAAAVVSRRHAEIKREPDGSFTLIDLKSFNGTLLNGNRISQPVPLHDGDRIQLSVGGPILRYSDPLHPASPPAPKLVPASQPLATDSRDSGSSDFDLGTFLEIPNAHQTLFFRAGAAEAPEPIERAAPQLVFQQNFDGQQQLSVGRKPGADIHLDGLLISNYHARFLKIGGRVLIEDTGSTNGVYLNGMRITGRQPVQPEDVIQIGPFLLKTDGLDAISIFDTRAKTRIDAIDISHVVEQSSGRGTVTLLNDVSLTIQPNEFVGLLGPSGAGKSTLMNALNGMAPTTSGQVRINNLDLYQHQQSLKQFIGYVPQDDIIHRELTVYRTLYYVARLRLSRDVRREEIDQIIDEVLEVTGLSERRDLRVSQLSGGQRKRVSIAVELITKPSVIFLDEPTSGLDPATQDKIMKLFRQIAESGRTVILTTHAMQDIDLFDKIIVLMRGRLIFYGTPGELLAFVGAETFAELYEKLEDPIELKVANLPQLDDSASKEQRRDYEERRDQIVEAGAEEWRQRFLETEIYRRVVSQPLSGIPREPQAAAAQYRRPGILDSIRQWATLVSRYAEVFFSDKLNLLILFAQAPIIGLMTYLVVGKYESRDFPYFVLALVSIWFGTSVAAREIVKERAIYKRERMVNLILIPYVGSKFLVLAFIMGLQSVLLFGILKLLHYSGALYLPGTLGGVPQLLTMLLTGIVGIGLGLFVSAVVKTSEMATSMVPLILIPQILFCGLVGVPTGLSRVLGAAMPATWSFDEMKRLSSLDTLKKEGSNPEGQNRGLGLFKHTEEANDSNIAKARKESEQYTQRTTQEMKDYERRMNEYLRGAGVKPPTATPPPLPQIGPAPPIPEAQRINDDLSNYVTFLHPWGGLILNPAILVLMGSLLIPATIITLWRQDIG